MEVEMQDINNFCFKIIFDMDNSDIGLLVNHLSEISDFLFFDDSVYVWLKDGCDKKLLLSKIKKSKITNFYCTDIYLKQILGKNNILESFVAEHFTAWKIRQFEKEHQQELAQMIENIERASKLISNQIKEQEAENGRRK